MTRLNYPNTDDIIFLKADINYTEFHLKNGKKLVSSTTLKYHAADNQLQKFIRISKSFLLNPTYISTYRVQNKDVRLYLTNGQELKVARRRCMEIRQRLGVKFSEK